MPGHRLNEELAALGAMSPAQLREKWTALTGKPVPRVSTAILRLAVGWELQVRAHGGLPRRVTQRLDQLAAARTETRDVRPGMRLVREWNGKLHIVDIGEDGTISWNGETWPSLSRVACAITGTRWSGPAFFGLRKPKAAA